MVEEDGSMGREIKHRIQCGWNNWRKVSGVICDKRVPVKLKGKVHKSVVRPAMTYGLETAPLRKVEERKLDVAEMKMLRWMVGVTKMDCIRNNYIRGSLKVTEISKNVQESRLRWYGHLLRRNEDHVYAENTQANTEKLIASFTSLYDLISTFGSLHDCELMSYTYYQEQTCSLRSSWYGSVVVDMRSTSMGEGRKVSVSQEQDTDYEGV
ncbi:uncharacterized protein LOC119582994 [Penaeus monodon]|uniref:uncharacterized protein LOC119582994 n=1 Tax=Penaeus monodon TaxID=6687 RepID=UPI0018A6FE6F|nr:uncharacterized protein LOC119582994 [Penaeus monodon]